MDPWTRTLSAALCAGALSVGCGGGPDTATRKDDAAGLGAATGNAAADTAVLGEAQAAVNVVIRAATDCEAAIAAMPAAREAIEAARTKLRTPTGQTTLNVLEGQLDRISDACG
jgi:hypothetical protein